MSASLSRHCCTKSFKAWRHFLRRGFQFAVAAIATSPRAAASEDISPKLELAIVDALLR